MKKNKILIVLLSMVMVLTILPMTSLAADPVYAWIDSTSLADGSTDVGDGTATLDKANSTLTLEDIDIAQLAVQSSETFTLVIKGDCIITADMDTLALYTSVEVPQLNIEIEEGASLTINVDGSNGIYVQGGGLNISGPGSLDINSLYMYPALWVMGDITLDGKLVADISVSDDAAIISKENIIIDDVDLTIKSYYEAIYAGMATEEELEDPDYVLHGDITLRNSNVDIEIEDGYGSGIWCYGSVLVEDTVLTTNIASYEGFSIYAQTNVTIKGDKTNITANDVEGIAADGDEGVLSIEGGVVSVTSVNSALNSRDELIITDGTVTAISDNKNAIYGQNGVVSITGADTKVTAITNDADYVAIGNSFSGGIYLAADVTANNTAGGKPIVGVKEDAETAITFGEGFSVYGAEVYTEKDGTDARSYLIPANGSGGAALTGTVVVCGHTWGAPEWDWADDYSSATATFTCGKVGTHIETLTAAITSQTTPSERETDGATVYTATVTFNGQQYTNSQTQTLTAAGHNAVKTAANAATCTEAGNIDYWYCEDCDTYFSDEACSNEIELSNTVVPAGHNAVKVDAKAPTATEAGNIEYWHCAACSKYFKNDDLTEEISIEDTIIPATGSQPGPNEPAGDVRGMWIWISLILMSVAGIAGTKMYVKKIRG